MLERLYRTFPSTFVARRNLARNRTRSILTMLGIAIGVVAVASLGIFGHTLKQDVTGEIGDIGSQVVVSPAYDEGVRQLTERDVNRIHRTADDALVAPMETGYRPVSAGEERTVVRVYGTERPRKLIEARKGTVPRRLRGGAVVGPTVAERLGVGVGDAVRVNGESYRVRGIAKPAGVSVIDAEKGVFLPRRAVPGEGYTLVVVDTESARAANDTAVALRETLNGRSKRASVNELSEQVERITGVFETLNAFITGVAAISLFVAGVGILNVMLMSAVERRQEVGVLRAVGLRRYDVLKIMLIEATLLGVAGSILGGVISVGTGIVVNAQILGDPAGVLAPTNLGYLGLAVGFGVLVGVLSGVYPAWKASKERPVEALRH